jgi:acetylornithine deacetylase/succinyl-diaminopimelate desuccinylase-like protein
VARGIDAYGVRGTVSGMGMGDLEQTGAWLVERAGSASFTGFLGELLFGLCAVDSVPDRDLARTARAEQQIHELLSRSIAERGLEGTVHRAPIPSSISRHWAFTFPYYAGTLDAYRGRFNLLHRHSPSGPVAPGRSVAVNAHIDTVAPHFPPRLEGGTLYGRGACDDKGSCAVMVGALALLREFGDRTGIRPRGRIVSMFVTDEESGGNGSLALALDRELAATYDTVLVLESTGGNLHPANRGAVWYRAEFPGRVPGRLRLALEVVRELERTGSSLREESSHPLFPDRPVPTCHGILGPFGDHPSSICGMVRLLVRAPRDEAAVRRALEPGLADYIARYGDKTKVADLATGRPKVEHHYELAPQGPGLELTVWGSAGHMGSIRENDDAITKAAFLLEGAWQRLPGFEAELAAADHLDPLVLEGGQGFLPTHGIEEVESRIRDAAGLAWRTAWTGFSYAGAAPVVSFEKLHNDAFDGDPESRAMKVGLLAASIVGITVPRPITGFRASCDARLFAREHPDKTVITTGPGSIALAHGQGERIELAEVAQSSAFLALYLLLLTGSIDAGESA